MDEIGHQAQLGVTATLQIAIGGPTMSLVMRDLVSQPSPSIPEIDQPSKETLRHLRPEVLTGVHSGVVKTVLGLYAGILAAFWLFFGIEEGSSALAIVIITILGIMFFGLLGGGILVSDALPEGLNERAFAEFLRGRVQIATGSVTGREAMLQIVFLPALLLIATCFFGAVWRIVAW